MKRISGWRVKNTQKGLTSFACRPSLTVNPNPKAGGPPARFVPPKADRAILLRTHFFKSFITGSRTTTRNEKSCIFRAQKIIWKEAKDKKEKKMTYKNTVGGSCHCGNVTFTLHTNKDDTEFVPRTCQCSLCKKHDASWVSDPEGEALLEYKEPEAVNGYRFGHKTSDFIVCKKCGVLTMALCEIDGVIRAVHNVKCMQDHKFADTPVLTNFDGEDVEQRLARRGQNWTKKVTVTTAAG